MSIRVDLTKQFRQMFDLNLVDAVSITNMVLDKVEDIRYTNEREQKLRELRDRREVQILRFQREANLEISRGNLQMAQQFLALIDKAEEDFRLAVERYY